ncbi:hypothetical protein QTO34_007909 [Cnephaeus nilssonii]|uniref:Uncharacterized protein n=1 Tax=Cnephaeus nilssonii TaxID=3371016 RepID=A0AA40LVQ2_CNENI|nr:hypothetical protein QTO34_007909 [Eptesicus nilssonii]
MPGWRRAQCQALLYPPTVVQLSPAWSGSWDAPSSALLELLWAPGTEAGDRWQRRWSGDRAGQPATPGRLPRQVPARGGPPLLLKSLPEQPALTGDRAILKGRVAVIGSLYILGIYTQHTQGTAVNPGTPDPKQREYVDWDELCTFSQKETTMAAGTPRTAEFQHGAHAIFRTAFFRNPSTPPTRQALELPWDPSPTTANILLPQLQTCSPPHPKIHLSQQL